MLRVRVCKISNLEISGVEIQYEQLLPRRRLKRTWGGVTTATASRVRAGVTCHLGAALPLRVQMGSECRETEDRCCSKGEKNCFSLNMAVMVIRL